MVAKGGFLTPQIFIKLFKLPQAKNPPLEGREAAFTISSTFYFRPGSSLRYVINVLRYCDAEPLAYVPYLVEKDD